MKANPVLVIAGAVIAVVAVWTATDARVPVPTGRGMILIGAPRVQFGPPSTRDLPLPGELEELARPVRSHALLAVTPPRYLMGEGNWHALSRDCVLALTDRKRQIRAQPSLLQRMPTLPSAADDTCRAADQAHLLTDPEVPGRRPRFSARGYRRMGTSGLIWMTPRVRQACAPWLEPRRINLEPMPGPDARLWCG